MNPINPCLKKEGNGGGVEIMEDVNLFKAVCMRVYSYHSEIPCIIMCANSKIQ
jgi:hypothetical protein